MTYYKSQWFCQSDCTNSDCQRHVNTRVLDAADEAGQKIQYMAIKTSACPWYQKPEFKRVKNKVTT